MRPGYIAHFGNLGTGISRFGGGGFGAKIANMSRGQLMQKKKQFEDNIARGEQFVAGYPQRLSKLEARKVKLERKLPKWRTRLEMVVAKLNAMPMGKGKAKGRPH